MRSMALIQDHLRSLGCANVEVKVMGGDSVVLTFESACGGERFNVQRRENGMVLGIVQMGKEHSQTSKLSFNMD